MMGIFIVSLTLTKMALALITGVAALVMVKMHYVTESQVVSIKKLKN